MKDRTKITTTCADGTLKEFDVILTFKNNDNSKDYVVYTDNSYDEKNKLRIFAAIYDEETLQFIEDVTSQDEWNKIYSLLDNVLNDR